MLENCLKVFIDIGRKFQLMYRVELEAWVLGCKYGAESAKKAIGWQRIKILEYFMMFG